MAGIGVCSTIKSLNPIKPRALLESEARSRLCGGDALGLARRAEQGGGGGISLCCFSWCVMGKVWHLAAGPSVRNNERWERVRIPNLYGIWTPGAPGCGSYISLQGCACVLARIRCPLRLRSPRYQHPAAPDAQVYPPRAKGPGERSISANLGPIRPLRAD